MGYDASCEVRCEGQRGLARAVLEAKELVVQGAVRLSIPFAEITEAKADAGWLRIRFGERTAALALGPAADKWALRIVNPPSRLTKLGVRAGMRVLVLDFVDAEFDRELRDAGAAVARRLGGPPADLLFYGLDRPKSLDRLGELVSAIVPAGGIWTLRPKGPRGVSEAHTLEAGRRAGLVDVKVVSFSDALTAEKFVIPLAKRRVPSAARGRGGPARPGGIT